MGRWFAQPWFRIVAIPFSLVLGLLTCANYYRIWSWKDFKTYREMSRECHPVWKDLNRGRIYAGQEVERVIAQTNPVLVERLGRFVVLRYQDSGATGVQIVAKDGMLLGAVAWSCTWQRTFFDQSTKADTAAFDTAQEASRVSKAMAAVAIWN